MYNRTLVRKKALICALCASMMMSMASCGTSQKSSVTQVDTSVATSTDADELVDVVKDSISATKNSKTDKDETVYVISGSDGKVSKVIVSEWLKNSKGEKELKDTSKLKDIENVKGDQTFTQDGDKITWQADGSDIYYQGTTDQALPVEVKVTYFLDDKEIKPEDLAGKSGKVKIRYDYINKAKDGDVYTPFMMATGMILKSEYFSNIEVTNGKVVSDGDKYIVVGVGMPGLSESLGLNDKDVELPSYVEITADAKDFQTDMSVTVASNNLLGEVNSDTEAIDDKVEKIENKVDDLTKQYSQGVNDLADGIKAYTDGAQQVADGVDQLDTGALKLSNGADQLNAGVESAVPGAKQLSEGANNLSNGIGQVQSGANQLAAGSDKLADGASKVKAGVDQMKGQLDSADSKQKLGSAVKGAQDLEDGLGQINKGVNGDGTAANPAIDQALKGMLLGQIPENYDAVQAAMTPEQQSAAQTSVTGATSQVKGGIDTAVDTYVVLPDDATLLAAIKKENNLGDTPEETQIATYILAGYKAGFNKGKEGSRDAAKGAMDQAIPTVVATTAQNTADPLLSQIRNGISSGIDQQATSADGKIAQLKQGVAEAYEGSKQLNAGTKTLVSKMGDLSNGLGQLQAGIGDENTKDSLINGVAQIQGGSKQLANGINTQLAPGAKQLANGVEQLDTGLLQLENGSAQLKNGASELKNGTSKLKSGTDELTSNNEKLVDGSKQLADATAEIMKRLDSAEIKAEDFADKLEAVKKASDDYQSFAGINKDMKGSVKFIFKVDGISVDKE